MNSGKKILLSVTSSDPILSRGCDIALVTLTKELSSQIRDRMDLYTALRGGDEDLISIFYKDGGCQFLKWDKKIFESKTVNDEQVSDAIGAGIVEMPDSFKVPDELVAVATDIVMVVSVSGVYFIGTVDLSVLVHTRSIPHEMMRKWLVAS